MSKQCDTDIEEAKTFSHIRCKVSLPTMQKELLHIGKKKTDPTGKGTDYLN
jgi:hypothetical protein